MKRSLICCAAFVIVPLLSGCKKSAPEIDGTTDRFADLYAQLLVLNRQFIAPNASLTPSEHESKIRELLTEYGLTEEDVRSRIRALSTASESFREFLQAVNDKLERLKAKTSFNRFDSQLSSSTNGGIHG